MHRLSDNSTLPLIARLDFLLSEGVNSALRRAKKIQEEYVFTENSGLKSDTLSNVPTLEQSTKIQK